MFLSATGDGQPPPFNAYSAKRRGARNGCDTGVPVPGAFKLDHLQPVKPILFPKISNFFTFIMGGQFLIPQRGEG